MAILQQLVRTEECFITVHGNWHPIDPITMVTDRLEGFALRETRGKKL